MFQSSYLNFPIAPPFLRVADLTVDRYLARIEQVLQSYQFIRLDDRVDIHFVHLWTQKGEDSNSRRGENSQDVTE